MKNIFILLWVIAIGLVLWFLYKQYFPKKSIDTIKDGLKPATASAVALH